MSEGDVSLIRDEDVLRRMWQQTEDFSRKKEIRAHMYRLREERLRNLYSPEPSLDAAKGCEFTSTQGHVKSFADQNFQSMKSKEVRDAGSPPKEFNYRGQDLKDLSNAGWNVESENKTTDDGHTRVKSINANIEGRYDVDGGKGHFTAADHQKQAVTEYNDGNTNLKRNEDFSKTSAHEQVVRQTEDGKNFTSTSSSSSSASKIEQISTTRKSAPYQADDNYDLQSQAFYDNNRNAEFTMKETKTNNQNQTSRNEYDQGELLSRDIDYPDDNTKVIIETRRLPDGTKVTSTRREFRAPSVQTRRSEHHSEQKKSESKSTSYSSTQKKAHSNELSSNVIYDESYNTNMQDIVDSQRVKDDFDFKKNDVTDFAGKGPRDLHYKDVKRYANDEYQNNSTQFYDSEDVRKEDVLENTIYNRKDYTNKDEYEVNKSSERKRNDYYIAEDNKHILKDDVTEDSLSRSNKNKGNERNEPIAHVIMNRRENKESSERFKATEYLHNISKESEVKENVETKSSHQYQTTYQTDYTHRKISTDLSPSHQAWASTLRSDTPPRSTSRAPSPGNKTYKSSTTSLRSSVSPDKKPSSRGVSPSKVDRYSPTRTLSEQTFSSTQSSYSVKKTNSNKYTDSRENYFSRNKSPTRHLYSPERKPKCDQEKRSSASPEKQTQKPRTSPTRPSSSPQRERVLQSGSDCGSPNRIPNRSTPSPERYNRQTSTNVSIDSKRDVCDRIDKDVTNETTINAKTNIADEPSYMRPTVSSSPKSNRPSSPTKQNHSDKTSPINQQTVQSLERQVDNIREENKMYTSISENKTTNVYSKYDIADSSTESKKTESSYLEKDDKDETMRNVETNVLERPDSQPSYMRPTVSSSPKSNRASSPSKQTRNDRKTPTNQLLSQSPVKQLDNEIREHERFVTEENKMYTNISENKTSNVHSKYDIIDTTTVSNATYLEKDDRGEIITNINNNIAECPDTQPSYMRPTESSSPKSNRGSSPTKQNRSDRKSPTKQHLSQTPDRHLIINDKVNEQHERYVKEENKMYTSNIENTTTNVHSNYDVIHTQDTSATLTSQCSEKEDEDETIVNKPTNIAERPDDQPTYTRPTESSGPKSGRPSSPTKQRHSDLKSPLHKLPSQSLDRQLDIDKGEHNLILPNNERVNTISENILSNLKKETHEIKKISPRSSPERILASCTRVSPTKVLPDKSSPEKEIIYEQKGEDKPSIKNKQPSRESSPIKRQISPEKIISKSNKEIPTYKEKPGVSGNKDRSPSPGTKESLRTRTVLKQKKETEQVVDASSRNDTTKNIQDKPTTPSASRSPSPNKRISDAKSKQTLDFITTEIYKEEINKITAEKPRTLHTPSTSPSRKPKSDEIVEEGAPSTGQSSPTTDSGFIYFSSKNEDHFKTENGSNLKERQRTPSPTKIPCRSPSPEKVFNKENLPRKSSLKKPSFDNGSVMSPPKPPTSFLISPDDEKKEVLKDKLNEKSDKPTKTKPPLERRETYEERCRKILGMTDDNSSSSTTTTVVKPSDTVTPKTSGVMPRESPIQVEDKDFCNDTYDLVNVVDITSKKLITNALQTETAIKDIQRSGEVNRQKSTQNYLFDQSQTLKQTSDTPNENLPQISTSTQDDLESEKVTDDYENLLSLNEINIDKVSGEDNNMTKSVSEFITTQKEQEILNRVQSSLRKLSPDRKSNSKLPVLNDKTTNNETINLESKESYAAIDSEVKITPKKKLLTEKSSSKNQIPSKPSSRNTSPTKKPVTSQNLTKHTIETVKPRSNSPKKPMSPVEKKHASSIERPQSPQVSKTSTATKEHDQKTSSSTLKNDKTELKKTSTISQSPTKTSSTKLYVTKTVSSTSNKLQDTENKTAQKSIHSPISKKEGDSKVLRTSSDINIKSPLKKISPQRIKSKPEIQLNNVTTNKIYKQNPHSISSKTQKSLIREVPTKLPVSKPKSATALNTSMDENDDIIIDVQQAKSSRENSPDRICPTPVGFSEDTGTPRFPDEVNEPDDEINKRSHNIIHEAESIVDDIVEISEEDELFIKAQETEIYKTQQKSHATDKLLKTNTTPSCKVNDSIPSNKNQVHRDLMDENLKSDECFLSVSEKVHKFAKGQVINKDKSPSRNIKEEYDKETIYTDDYTKLSVNDKAHLFIETAENVKTTTPKMIQKPVRPDLSSVDESLKSDECLLSVSDKVNKFVKTAELVSSDTHIIDEKEKKIREEHEKLMKRIVDDVDENLTEEHNISMTFKKYETLAGNDDTSQTVCTTDDNISKLTSKSNNLKNVTKQTDKHGSVKITTLRSSEAVKKAKALFENIASTAKTKETPVRNRTTKLTDIGVSKKTPRSEESQPTQESTPKIQQTDFDEEQNRLKTTQRQKSPEINQILSCEINENKVPINRTASPQPRNETHIKPITREKSPLPRSPHTRDKSPMARTKSPMLREVSPVNTKKSPVSQTATIVPKKVLSRLPVSEQVDSAKQVPLENKQEKSVDKMPGYQRPTKTSQLKEEKHVEEIEVSRRGSGKFGVELRRTSADRSSVSSERRRSSVEHHQPCIEDIFDLDLLEQMLEKVVGYEQRRRIRAQTRVAKKKIESEETTKNIKSLRQSTNKVLKTKSPERLAQRSPERIHVSKKNLSPEMQIKNTSPERQPKSIHNKSVSPDRQQGLSNLQEDPQVSLTDGQDKKNISSNDIRAQSPEKHMRSTPKTVRQPISDKKRPGSPTKMPPNTKGTRFSEYASAYMKKVGLHETDKLKHKTQFIDEAKTQKRDTKRVVEVHHVKTTIDRTSSKDIIEVQIEGKKSPSPSRSLDRNDASSQQPQQQGPVMEASNEPLSEPSSQNTERQNSPKRSPSPETKKNMKKETRTTFDIEKKIAQKQVQEDKPSWVTNRNLKKVTSESRTFSSKKIETEKPKYRPSSPSKAITKPIDVITSSYGPGPLDADGRPLFGIKALRNGATNYQVKGTVIRQEFHSRNGSEPEGTVSVTAYSTEPEDLEKLLQNQGEKPSRLHGLAAITTTKKFGGDTGTTISEVATKEERAALEQFTEINRRITESDTDTHSESLRRRDQREKIERVSNRVETKSQNQKLSNQTVESSVKKDTRSDRMQRKTVRQSSVKSLTEKFIKNACETTKTERTVYPKAGLILRTAGMKDSVSSDSSAHAGLARTDSEHSLASVEDTITTTTTTTEQVGDMLRTTTTVTKTGGRTQERSFLDSSTKVTGVQDILTRMKNADIVIEDGDSNEDTEARALLNKFLGASVLMAGMRSYVSESGAAQERSKIGSGVDKLEVRQREVDIEQCWDERVLRKLLDECTDYDLRRRLRARIRALMAEQEACASAVTEALAAAGETVDSAETEEHQQTGEREEEEITNVTSSVRRNSTEQTISSTSVKSTKVIESQPAVKPVSPFAKFRQLEKQNSINSPNSPKTPQSPGSTSQPYFKFTDPALQLSAVTIKERLLQWCRDKTRDYENVKLENFSTSWADGLAFCALLHHFLPDAFDYSQLTPDKRRHNFTLAFKVADEKAGIYPLLDVDDMVAMRKPDWKCVFTYVQSIHRRFKDEL